MIKGSRTSIWITNCPEIPAPTNPAIEFTQIKSAAVAAAVACGDAAAKGGAAARSTGAGQHCGAAGDADQAAARERPSTDPCSACLMTSATR